MRKLTAGLAVAFGGGFFAGQSIPAVLLAVLSLGGGADSCSPDAGLAQR